MAVGAQGEDSAATGVNGDQADNTLNQAGAVYLFTLVEGVWSQKYYIKASNPGVGDDFGSGLALDEESLAVAAKSEDSGATGVGGDQTDNASASAGAAYVFR